jgi:uncharacterized protein YgiM (DUF1202 family)
MSNVRDRLLNPKVLDKPRRLNPNLSASTEAAILKAIEVHPSQRFQTADQMRAALGGKSVRSVAPVAPVHRRRWAAPVGLLLVLALLAAAAWSWRSGLFSPPAGASPTVAATAVIVAAMPALDVAASLEPADAQTATADVVLPATAMATTSASTATPMPAPTETASPVPTNTPQPTSTSAPTDTPTLRPTATPATPRAFASGETNLRAGPGTEYPVVGSLPAGGSAEIIGRNQAGTWLQLDSQAGDSVWIIADRVEVTGLLESLAVVVIPPTPTPAATATPARPGLVADFESGSAWRIGNQNYGQLASSREQAYAGSSAGRLSYTFPAVADNYAVFLAPSAIPIGGQPTGLTAAVYGDGSGHYLNAWIQDAAGEVRAYSFGQVVHSGWQQMTAWLDDARPWPNGHISGGDNGRLDYPVILYALVLDGVPDGAASSGVIYLDELLATSAALPTPVASPAAPTPTPAGGTTRSALLPGAPAPGQTAGVGGLLGLGALLGIWLVAPRTGKPRRNGR